MKTNKQKLKIEFDSGYYEKRVIEILGDGAISTHQMNMLKGYFRVAFVKGESSGIKLASERFDNVYKTSK
tara:strand:- start:112 stop:321 length:210 start_codon:yes stop_codon:yes gene_type:complete